MTARRNSLFMLDGRSLGPLSFALTVALFAGTLLLYLGGGSSLDPRTMYISDLGDIPGLWTSTLYSSGMLLLVPLRLLFLLFIVSVFADLRTEIIDARTWGGLHFHSSSELAVTIGQQLVTDALTGYFAPAPDRSTHATNSGGMRKFVDTLPGLNAAGANNLGQYITGALENKPFPFQFYVVKDNTLNAFAGPGGYIFFFTGLIDMMDDVDELAAVMAHEIGHVSARHLANRMEQNKAMTIAVLAGMLAGALMGGKAGGAIATGTMAAGIQKQLSYSREDERQADNLGFKYMEVSRFSGFYTFAMVYGSTPTGQRTNR